MSSHSVYESYVKRLTLTGCITVTPENIASLINQTNSAISKNNPQMCSAFEELIYSIILHDSVTYNNMIGNVPKFVQPSTKDIRRTEIAFAEMPQHLLQILYTVIMDVRKM